MENSSKKILQKVYNNFHSNLKMEIQISAEIEFYFSSGDRQNDTTTLALILATCKKENIPIYKIENETGLRQHEIALERYDDPVKLADTIIELKNIISKSAQKFGSNTLFEAKPFLDQPGCGLHIHISLHKDGKSLFKKDRNVTEESPLLLNCVGGLCETMLESMIYFAPREDCYKRYTAELNADIPDENPMRKYNNAPVNISWGGNNRTTAIRIPTSTLIPDDRHIEHRVPSANADPYLVIAAIIAGIQYGIEKKITPPEKLYGNAFDEKYNFSLLPKNLAEAIKFSERSFIVSTFFDS